MSPIGSHVASRRKAQDAYHSAMTLFSLDQVRNGHIDHSIEPVLQQVREQVAVFQIEADQAGFTFEDILEVFDQSRARFNIIVSFLQRYDCSTVADISTGFGLLPVLLSRLGIDVVATELDLQLPVFARAHNIPLHHNRIGSGPLPLKPASFDAVIFGETLEHIKRPPIEIIRQLVPPLHNDGLLIVTTPNVARLAHIQALVAGENFLEPFADDTSPDVDPTDAIEHIREYSVREVVEAIEAVGLSIDAVEMVGWGQDDYDAPANPWVKDVMVIIARR